ncbi:MULTISPECIES: c-type cytochrome [unclassified Methylocaldum]|jgi:mono/diheme cytochrome c family protein|uniref:c-type cytochrome n=1 Tax=unclassified Methylocaldum TaxID=2622260 RepID=UPI00197C1B77|nr:MULTISPECIES: cytochrome c [unclassified Methylocaldum]MBP1149957.1 mono/diheme cytochrome c family protein [Methylocaldum sp. RMAD-M]MDV3242889.1 cytochrome c [Methylocaldum sp.]
MAPSRKFLIHALITLVILGGFGVLGAAIVVLTGVYNVAAIYQHTWPVYEMLDFALDRSVSARLGGIAAPPLDDPLLAERGFRIYRDKCAQCHGAPGVPPDDAGKGMLPLPNNLAQTAREKSAEYIYWVVANGIRMTGMPAWQYRLDEEELWAVVAFVERLPEFSPKEYAEWDRKTGGR